MLGEIMEQYVVDKIKQLDEENKGLRIELENATKEIERLKMEISNSYDYYNKQIKKCEKIIVDNKVMTAEEFDKYIFSFKEEQ